MNLAGQLSAIVPRADLIAAGVSGVGGDVRGYEVRYEHPTAGEWAGVIQTTPRRSGTGGGDGVIEIAAWSWEILLRGRLGWSTGRRTAGAHLSQMLARTRSEDALAITTGSIDGGGQKFRIDGERPGEDIYDAGLPLLVDVSGWEWRVTTDKRLDFGPRLGRDLTATVRLTEGREIVAAEWVDDAWDLQNWLFAWVPEGKIIGRGDNRRAVATPAEVRDTASIDRWGLRQGVREGVRGSKAETMAKLRRELETSADPPALVRLDLADEDGVFASFREGDDVTVDLPLCGVTGTVRVVGRSLDVGRKVMSIYGEGRRA